MPVVRVVTHRAVRGALVSKEHKIAFSAAFLVLVKQEYIWVDIRVSEPLPGEAAGLAERSEARNLVIVSVTLVFGIGGMVIGGKAFALSGISLCAISALALNLLLPGGSAWRKHPPIDPEI
jgi:hypothetical protein